MLYLEKYPILDNIDKVEELISDLHRKDLSDEEKLHYKIVLEGLKDTYDSYYNKVKELYENIKEKAKDEEDVKKYILESDMDIYDYALQCFALMLKNDLKNDKNLDIFLKNLYLLNRRRYIYGDSYKEFYEKYLST